MGMLVYIILGAGITGLSAVLKNSCIIYEATPISGGICVFYYIERNKNFRG